MKLEEAVLIHADPISLFRLTQDYERRLEWDPFLQSANLIGDAKEAGVGVKALCVSKGGWAMETEYVSFNPPHATAVKMTRARGSCTASPDHGDSRRSCRGNCESASLTTLKPGPNGCAGS